MTATPQVPARVVAAAQRLLDEEREDFPHVDQTGPLTAERLAHEALLALVTLAVREDRDGPPTRLRVA